MFTRSQLTALALAQWLVGGFQIHVQWTKPAQQDVAEQDLIRQLDMHQT